MLSFWPIDGAGSGTTETLGAGSGPAVTHGPIVGTSAKGRGVATEGITLVLPASPYSLSHRTSSLANEGCHGEATEGNPLVLPASPCLQPHPTSTLATEGNPPRSLGLSKRFAKPLQVYSRRRYRSHKAAHPKATTTGLATEQEPEDIPKSRASQPGAWQPQLRP